MTKRTTFQLSILLSLFFATGSFGQTPMDAIFMQKKFTCIAAIYEHSSFDQYWEGTLLRTNGTIETVKSNSFMPMVAIGITDRINVLVGVPYTSVNSTAPNGGFLQGAKGFGDFQVGLKGEIFKKEAGPGKLSAIGYVGYGNKASNYSTDYRPYILGHGAPELTLRGMINYRFNNGIYTRGLVGHLWRGTTRTERNYHYADGSHYSFYMDVPNAWQFQAVAGIWLFDEVLKVQLNYTALQSVSGDDIRPYTAAQPTNRVNVGNLGLELQTYLKKPYGLGAIIYASQVIHGRNMGKPFIFGGGLTYFFHV